MRRYEVKKPTVVFGGHETWLKAIRPMVSGNIKFIGKERIIFDKAVFRNADVIWIQSNSISHKQFYRIMNGARLNNIPVFYFSNASAKKCVSQIEEKDK